MKEIKSNNILYAIYEPFNFQEGSTWYGDTNQGLQLQRMCYHQGKTFNLHRHIYRPRTFDYSQECFVMLQGSLLASIYDNEKILLADITLQVGDMLTCYKGWHEFEVLQDGTICYEIKNGPYTGEDKEWSVSL